MAVPLHPLPVSAVAVWKMAEQLGSMVEHLKTESTQPDQMPHPVPPLAAVRWQLNSEVFDTINAKCEVC